MGLGRAGIALLGIRRHRGAALRRRVGRQRGRVSLLIDANRDGLVSQVGSSSGRRSARALRLARGDPVHGPRRPGVAVRLARARAQR